MSKCRLSSLGELETSIRTSTAAGSLSPGATEEKGRITREEVLEKGKSSAVAHEVESSQTDPHRAARLE